MDLIFSALENAGIVFASEPMRTVILLSLSGPIVVFFLKKLKRS